MKRFFLIPFLVIVATACSSPQETPQPLIPPTSTLVSTPTREPSPTPTPEPYLLEDGVLLDWNEELGEYLVVAEEIDSLITTTDGMVNALDNDGILRFSFDEDDWVEVKIDPNYGYIAPKVWGVESLPSIKEWWEGYKEKMPTNEDVKWLTYEDGSKVELGEIPGLRYASTRTFGFVLAEMFDFPDSIDPQNVEQMIFALSPTNPERIEEAGNIVPIRLTASPGKLHWTVGLRIIGENGAVRESLNWNSLDIAKGLTHGELIRFMRMGLEGDNPPFYGCQLAVSLAGSDSEVIGESDHIQSIYGEEGDGEWRVDSNVDWLALNPQGAGMFAIPESCMTEEMWDMFGTLK